MVMIKVCSLLAVVSLVLLYSVKVEASPCSSGPCCDLSTFNIMPLGVPCDPFEEEKRSIEQFNSSLLARSSSSSPSSSYDLCLGPSLCNGYTANCPVAFLPAGTLCENSTGSCDWPSYCTGDSPDCPPKTFKPIGTTCGTNPKCTITTNNTCDASGLCVARQCATCPNGKFGADCTCTSPAPSNRGFSNARSQCIDGIWVINSTVSVSSDFSTKGAIVILGNFSVPVNSTVTISKIDFTNQKPILNVTGCSEVNGTVVIEIDDSAVKELDSLGGRRTVQLIQGQCGGNGRATIQANTEESCKKVVVSKDPNESQVSLSVIFSLDKSKCNRWWIILVSVVGGVILVVIIVALVATFTPLIKYIRPFTQRAKTV